MRNIYISVILFVALAAALLTGSFIYLDRANRKTFHYIIQEGDHTVGTIRIDRFMTEDKIIYRSVRATPLEPYYTEQRTRLVVDKRYNLESYTREMAAGRATDLLYIENFKNSVSFVSRQQSRFAAVENIPVRRGTLVFEEESPMTYLPIIENYNFDRGRSQGFYELIPQASLFLPPRKRFVILTSINDEYLKIEKKKIKTENLILRIRDFPQAGVWVAKSDRSIMRLDIPSRNLKIIRTFRPAAVTAVQPEPPSGDYTRKDVSFKNGAVELAGTLTIPPGGGTHPAVLLVWGYGAQNRQYQGVFTSLADSLAGNGFAVLAFDKRGVGSSRGDIASATEADIVGDIRAALAHLAGEPSVDQARIAILGHGRGALYALRAAAATPAVKCLVLMAPSGDVLVAADERAGQLIKTAEKLGWNRDYFSLVARTAEETEKRAVNTKGAWTHILGKKCFLEDTRMQLAADRASAVQGITVPVLTLQGGRSDEGALKAASAIDKALREAGNTNHALRYYAYLDRMLGPAVRDGIHRTSYEVDKEVRENIVSWLNENLIRPAEPPAKD